MLTEAKVLHFCHSPLGVWCPQCVQHLRHQSLNITWSFNRGKKITLRIVLSHSPWMHRNHSFLPLEGNINLVESFEILFKTIVLIDKKSPFSSQILALNVVQMLKIIWVLRAFFLFVGSLVLTKIMHCCEVVSYLAIKSPK